jgi:hypothetical protein
MNKDRRKRIDTIYAELEQWVSMIEDLESEEQDAFDGMPEGLQDSERGQTSQSAIDSLVDARDSLTNALDALDAARSES